MEHETKPSEQGAASDLWRGSLSDHRARQAEQIIAVTLELITRDGIASLSMSAIADAADISRQTLYKYFADVDAVLLGLAALVSTMDAQIADRIEAEADPVVGLRTFIETVMEVAAAGHPSPAALTSALPPQARVDLRAHADRAEVIVVDLLRRGRDDGSFRSDLDAELDGRIVYRAIVGSHDLAAEPGADVARLARHLFRSILSMVGADSWVQSTRKS